MSNVSSSSVMRDRDVLTPVKANIIIIMNNNNKIQHLYSAIFTECSMALYVVSRII